MASSHEPIIRVERDIGFRLGTAPLSSSWIISIIGVYIALNRTPNIDCYSGGQYPRFRV